MERACLEGNMFFFFFFQFGVKFASKDWKSREACRPVIWVFLNLKTRLLRVGMW